MSNGNAVGSARKMTAGWQSEYVKLDLRCGLMESILDATSAEIHPELKDLRNARCKLANSLKSILDFVRQSDSGEGRQPRVAERKRTRRTSGKYKNQTKDNET